jgi:hypothetical protein
MRRADDCPRMPGDDNWGVARIHTTDSLVEQVHRCELLRAIHAAGEDELLRRIRLRPKAGFGGQERSSQ